MEMFQAMLWQGVALSVIIANALISTHEKSKQPDRAFEVFQAMQRQGMVLETITYNALIGASTH